MDGSIRSCVSSILLIIGMGTFIACKLTENGSKRTVDPLTKSAPDSQNLGTEKAGSSDNSSPTPSPSPSATPSTSPSPSPSTVPDDDGGKDGNPTQNDTPTQNSGSGSKDCVKHRQTIDESVSFTFRSGTEIRNFINSFGTYTTIPDDATDRAGALRNDSITANKICELKEFARAISSSHSRYKSCDDNTVAHWDTKTKNFIVEKACRNNDYISQLTCRGQIKKECN